MNYPVGTENSPDAPYNEPLDTEHKRFVSVSLSFNYTYKGHPDVREEVIREAVEKYIKSEAFSNQPFDIDELVILKE